MKNIVVIGGGTAGWLSALAAKKRYSDYNITVIESKEIGILGAGEGSTPDLIPFLQSLNISIEDLIRETKSTLKFGIKFNNFSYDHGYYYHGFSINKLNPKSDGMFIRKINNSSLPELDLFYMANDINQNKYKISAIALDNNRIPLTKNINSKNSSSDFDFYHLYSLHFDARLLADFLYNKAISRDINHIDAKIVDFNLNNGNIESIVLDDGSNIFSDFVVDCSGFARIINRNVFNTNWVSFENNLPAKKAIPFFLDIDKENIPAYTESTAMDYGWMWKIPLQHRYGCGYVFDSNFIDEDTAKFEIEKMLGHEIKSPKIFSFIPGYYKTIWNGNTIAIGLSSGFVEPLEATSIMQSVKILQMLFKKDLDIFNSDTTQKDLINSQYVRDCEEIRDFLYLHYMTNKNNTDFWQNFTSNNEMPETLKERIDSLFNLTYEPETDSFFSPISYYIIMNGNKLINKDIFETINNRFSKDKDLFDLIKNRRNSISNNFITHSYFIKYLGGLNE